MNKQIHIFGGGTFVHVANHFALSAPAFGNVARMISQECQFQSKGRLDTISHLTRMADPKSVIVTNEDLRREVDSVRFNPLTKIVFFSAAVCDFEPFSVTSVFKHKPQEVLDEFGKDVARLDSSAMMLNLALTPSEKIVGSIREKRKDIFLVSFKATCGDTSQEMFLKGLALLKRTSSNLVLVNDTKTHFNMIVTPEEAVYHETQKRQDVIQNLVEMALLRSHLTFTQSTVIDGKPVPWDSPLVPDNLRGVVNACVQQNAYKPFRGATVGHFACRIDEQTFLTSIRKSDFNHIDKTGLVLVKTDGPDTVIAYGAKPSVGGQSQRTVFKDHPGYECIVHFHCPLREDRTHNIPIRSQREVECGSHECGKNTSNGLEPFVMSDSTGSYVLKAVMLDKHGPNIVFGKEMPAQLIINFITQNFDLSKKTGGYHL